MSTKFRWNLFLVFHIFGDLDLDLWPWSRKIQWIHLWALPTMFTKFCWNLFASFCVKLLTNIFTFSVTLTLTFDLDHPKFNGFISRSYPPCPPSFVEICSLFFTFSVTLTLTFDLDRPKFNGFIYGPYPLCPPSFVEICSIVFHIFSDLDLDLLTLIAQNLADSSMGPTHHVHQVSLKSVPSFSHFWWPWPWPLTLIA